jgi:hypothetical protein
MSLLFVLLVLINHCSVIFLVCVNCTGTTTVQLKLLAERGCVRSVNVVVQSDGLVFALR